MLRSAVGRPEVLKAARAWRIMHRWPEIVGEGLAERSTPDRYDRGTVWVAVRGSCPHHNFEARLRAKAEA